MGKSAGPARERREPPGHSLFEHLGRCTGHAALPRHDPGTSEQAEVVHGGAGVEPLVERRHNGWRFGRDPLGECRRRPGDEAVQIDHAPERRHQAAIQLVIDARPAAKHVSPESTRSLATSYRRHMRDTPAAQALAHSRQPAVILAGGRSTRFGSDKASALLRGEPLLAWVAAAAARACDGLVVVRAAGQQLPAFTVPIPVAVVEDRVPERGPLAGLIAGFAEVGAPVVFATSCDTPLLQPALIRLLFATIGDEDTVVPRVANTPQPLAAVYRVSACLPVFEAALARGEGSVRHALVDLRVRSLEEESVREADPELRSFDNANTREALALLDSRLAFDAGPGGCG